MRGYRKWQTLETGRYNAKSGGHFSYLRVKIVNFDHSLTCTLFGTHQKCDIYRTFFRFYRRKLGIPIDRVPTSESCVFCLGRKFLFFPIWPFLGPFLLQGLFSWKGVMHVITLWGSGGESVLRFSLVALQTWYVKRWSVMRDIFWKNKISFAEEAIGNIIKSSYMIYCRLGFTS